MLLPATLLTETPTPAQDADASFTQIHDTLKTVIVTADRGITVSRADTLKSANSQTLTELFLQSPGLILADYGGAGRLKSINLRGLGSPLTTIYVDGIKVTDVQTGQPELDLLGLENFDGAVVDYAQNSVNFCTSRPVFGPSSKGNASTNVVAGRIGLYGGSFGTFLPQGRLDFRLSDKVSLSANASGVISKGNFKYGDGAERINNDTRQFKGGIDIFGLTGGGDWKAKVFFSNSDRGTPGSADWPSTDRQQDRKAFAQGLWRQRFTPLYSLNISGKIARDDVHYTSEWGDSDYAQNEVQLNTAQKFRPCKWLDLSLVVEFQWDGLKSTYYDASRTDASATAGMSVKLQRFTADLTLQYEGVFDKDALSRNVFSPSVDLRFNATDDFDIFGFARRAYRTPTFNELYYPGYGNPDLKPEDAWLTDIGIDFHKKYGGRWSIMAKIDGFYNYLTNKIVSAPSDADPSIWLPFNIGEVRSAGFDIDAGFIYATNDWRAGFKTRYSFQNAENVPYLSKHTLVIIADASYKTWSANALWNLRGGRKESAGEMPDWNTLDLIFAKAFNFRNCGPLILKLIRRNVNGCSYELVTGYPMPGRSFMGGVEFKF